MNPYQIRLEVSGAAACFTRPEFKVERVSYDCMPPSAAVGILKSVYWHPGMDWAIERIHVCKPIRFATIVRNEVQLKGNGREAAACYRRRTIPKGVFAADVRTQRSTRYLKDVRYVIEAHPILLDGALHDGDSLTKFFQIFLRRARKGQCFSPAYLGCREFPVERMQLLRMDDPVEHEDVPDKPLGFMLYAIDYHDPKHIRPAFFSAELRDGVVEVAGKEIYR